MSKDTKICARCKAPKALAEFCRNSATKDGRQSWCKDCARDYMRGRSGDPAARRRSARDSAKRYPERRRAREKVKDAIRRGDLARASDCMCTDCGKPADAYDHAAGYDNPLDVEPVCHECHGRRSRVRGEHRRAGRTWDQVPADG